jgi:hypothetical protein
MKLQSAEGMLGRTPAGAILNLEAAVRVRFYLVEMVRA